jgi:hypothetical protein
MAAYKAADRRLEAGAPFRGTIRRRRSSEDRRGSGTAGLARRSFESGSSYLPCRGGKSKGMSPRTRPRTGRSCSECSPWRFPMSCRRHLAHRPRTRRPSWRPRRTRVQHPSPSQWRCSLAFPETRRARTDRNPSCRKRWRVLRLPRTALQVQLPSGTWCASADDGLGLIRTRRAYRETARTVECALIVECHRWAD